MVLSVQFLKALDQLGQTYINVAQFLVEYTSWSRGCKQPVMVTTEIISDD